MTGEQSDRKSCDREGRLTVTNDASKGRCQAFDFPVRDADLFAERVAETFHMTKEHSDAVVELAKQFKPDDPAIFMYLAPDPRSELRFKPVAPVGLAYLESTELKHCRSNLKNWVHGVVPNIGAATVTPVGAVDLAIGNLSTDE